MASLKKATSRDRKRERRSKMVVDNRSIFVVEEQKVKRAEQIKKDREQKANLLDSHLDN
jgi:hypothetical protein